LPSPPRLPARRTGHGVLLPLHFVGRSFSSGDASYVLPTSFHTRDISNSSGGANRSGFSEPELDRKIREMMVRMDDGRGRRAMKAS
jgi:ABC-type transport system substrate-binding protein